MVEKINFNYNLEVAFLVVTFNEPLEWVVDSFQSMILQTIKPKEVIHIDNSINKNYNLEKLFSNTKIVYKYIIPGKKITFTNALNLGLKSSTCEIICRQDPDDYSNINRIERAIEFYKKNDFTIFGTRSNIISEKGNIIGKTKILNKYIRIEDLKSGNPLIHGSITFNRNKIINLGGYNDNISKAQDYELYSWLAINNIKIGYLDEILYNLRIHSGSVSNNSKSSQLQAEISFKVKEKILLWSESTNIKPKRINYTININNSLNSDNFNHHKRRIYRNKIYSLSVNGMIIKTILSFEFSFFLIWFRGLILSVYPSKLHRVFYR